MKMIKQVLIVGGGTAGWLAACHLAKKLQSGSASGVQITLLESATIPTIGVGEGTVPAIRQSLQYLGISETDFIRECDVTLKQSIQFVDWMKPAADGTVHRYHHLFDYPDLSSLDLTPYWLQGLAGDCSYADAVSWQGRLCDAGLAPKTMLHAEFNGHCNYAYHLDAVKFARLLTRHATEKLGVKHLLGTVQQVECAQNGAIAAVLTPEHGRISADIFIDCTGFSALLIGEACKVPFIAKNDVMFVDSALAVQVPYASSEQAIPCYTIATAREAGWIWDIGLSARRGTGYVYASRYTSDERAEQVLRQYLQGAADQLPLRKIDMKVGYREKFWHHNCIALGLSQGFVEPLEATGLLIYDATARMLADLFPPHQAAMPMLAERFNQRVRLAWDKVIDFIKLHYYLSDRDDSAFWRDNRDPASVPASLLANLEQWRYQLPSPYDFHSKLEVFNLENYLYVLYGMGFHTDLAGQEYRFGAGAQAQQMFGYYQHKFQQLQSELLPHRELIRRVQQYGLQKI
ncbi:tryptophan halogenase family protein [Rheinheimera sp.]|uniref:tryptophan halogenase family protein n=1 Tax=Rheinheimera sp. TaxID=1869214 RepID=UPI0027B99609|nr:tryptophan halogenase family protein [Rheinheimera sp.]